MIECENIECERKNKDFFRIKITLSVGITLEPILCKECEDKLAKLVEDGILNVAQDDSE